MGILDWLFFRTKKARRRVLSGTDRELARREWKEIQNLLDLEDPSARKEALIRADKLLGLVLAKIAMGKTLGERLKNAESAFSAFAIYDGLWKAHKLRNAMVHETGFEPPYYSLRKAIRQIGAGLRDLGVRLD